MTELHENPIEDTGVPAEDRPGFRFAPASEIVRGHIIDWDSAWRKVSCTHLQRGGGVRVCFEDGTYVDFAPDSQRKIWADSEAPATQSVPEDTTEAAADIPVTVTEDETGVYAAGGWCAPSEVLYSYFDPFPEVRVRRGGISFTAPKPLTKKQLRKRVDDYSKALNETRAENAKLRRKVKRLIKLIEKGV